MLHVNELLGKSVFDAHNKYIGEVTDLDIEKKTWLVSDLHIKLSDKCIKEFGVRKKLKHPNLHIPTSIVKEVGIVITLNQPFEELQKTYPPFDKV